jgi:site-specific DNA-adenine methylase
VPESVQTVKDDSVNSRGGDAGASSPASNGSVKLRLAKRSGSTLNALPNLVLERRSNEPRIGIRPFFGYYGGKWRDALKHYPRPTFDTIVEPFAGSAGYSLRYHDRNVILCEIDPILVGVWKYLIRAKPREILSIPNIESGMSVDDLQVCQEARWLVGFWLNRGVASPRKSPSRWMRDGIRPGSFWGPRVRETIASQLQFIRHWKVYQSHYQKCPATSAATWFIDPPYQQAGRHYRFGSNEVNYKDLSLWCRSRFGQVIVCENAGADWLPFHEIGDVKTTRSQRRSKEVLWIRRKKAADNGNRRVMRSGS